MPAITAVPTSSLNWRGGEGGREGIAWPRRRGDGRGSGSGPGTGRGRRQAWGEEEEGEEEEEEEGEEQQRRVLPPLRISRRVLL